MQTVHFLYSQLGSPEANPFGVSIVGTFLELDIEFVSYLWERVWSQPYPWSRCPPLEEKVNKTQCILKKLIKHIGKD